MAAIRKTRETMGDKLLFATHSESLGLLLKKLLEYEWRSTDDYVSLYVSKEEATKRAEIRGPPSDVLVVKAEGKTYADLFREVKQKVSKEEAGEVLSVRRVGEREELKIRVRASPSTETLKELIRSKVQGAVVFQGGRGTRPVPFQIRDLEEETTEDDVRSAVAEELGETVEKIKVTSVRPAYGCTKVANITVPSSCSAKLKEKMRIKIGWVACRVLVREPIDRCYRCWETGHFAAQCSSVDRSKLCFRCGEEGHRIATCISADKCLDCGAVGHRFGSQKCPNRS